MARLRRPSNRKHQKADAQNDETGDVPPDVLGESVIQNAEPREHLPEQPPVKDIGESARLSPAAGPAAVVKPHINHLYERIDPRQHTDAAQLGDEQWLRAVRGTDRVKD